jgi:hypothetical protein
MIQSTKTLTQLWGYIPSFTKAFPQTRLFITTEENYLFLAIIRPLFSACADCPILLRIDWVGSHQFRNAKNSELRHLYYSLQVAIVLSVLLMRS